MADLEANLAAHAIKLADQPDFAIGRMQVRPAALAVEIDGIRREMQPRIMQVLVALAQARSQVVSRDRLIERCWNGLAVGDDALNRCVLALRHLAEEFSAAPFAIETVPRVGYRLVESPQAILGRPAAQHPLSTRRLAVLVAILLVIFAGLFALRRNAAHAEPPSIGMLPFRNLSGGSPYFTMGLSAEIFDQLAREPGLRVAGRSGAAPDATDADLEKLRRAMAVDYVLEGSVRTSRDRVRVNASLIKVSSGTRLWTETYDRQVDDAINIQIAIAQSVARELRGKLGPVNGKQAALGGAYALYLNARGLLRAGGPSNGHEAAKLLRQAVRIDPNYAPAWSSLAEAMQLEARTTGSEGMVAMLPHARAAAARSLQIDPDLAQAHGVYALLIGNDTRNGIAHLRRAAALDPNSADGLIWQSQAEHASGRFASAMSLNRRAHDIDVLWMNPVMMMVDLHASLSERQAAEAAARVAFADDALMEQFALARIAWLLGDYSEAGRRWSIVSHSSSRWTAPSQLSLENVKYLLKLTTNLPSRAPLPSLIHSRYGPRLWTTVAPSPPEWRNRNRSNEAALVYRDDNELAAKLMLAAGRAGELVATYDSNVGLMAIRQDEPMGLCMLQDVPTLALALRAVGRAGEANALLVQAEALVRTVYRGGKVPAWFDDDAAGVWSVQGKLGLAMDALERAQRRGWVHAGPSDLELESEPAFQALRNLPRFRAIIVKRKSLLARERQQALRDIA